MSTPSIKGCTLSEMRRKEGTTWIVCDGWKPLAQRWTDFLVSTEIDISDCYPEHVRLISAHRVGLYECDLQIERVLNEVRRVCGCVMLTSSYPKREVM